MPLPDTVAPCPCHLAQKGIWANDGNTLAAKVLLISKTVRKQGPLIVETGGAHTMLGPIVQYT